MSQLINTELPFMSVEVDPGLAAFEAALVQGGLPSALQFLNARTTFRYSAIYRIDGGFMRNICLFDRLGQAEPGLQSVPIGDSFCQFAMADDGFRTSDSAHDRRLDGHPFQGVLNAYFGLPLSDRPGTIYGTLCHFDLESKQIDDSEVPFLEAIRPILMARLP